MIIHFYVHYLADLVLNLCSTGGLKSSTYVPPKIIYTGCIHTVYYKVPCVTSCKCFHVVPWIPQKPQFHQYNKTSLTGFNRRAASG